MANIFWMGFGDLITPKWPIKVPRHIPIFFGTVLELPKMCPNIDPRDPYLLQKYFNKYKKYGNNFKNISCVKMGTYNLNVFDTLCTNMFGHI